MYLRVFWSFCSALKGVLVSETRSPCSFRCLRDNFEGSLIRAWKKALDTSGDGKLSFTEFTNAVRRACLAISYRIKFPTL